MIDRKIAGIEEREAHRTMHDSVLGSFDLEAEIGRFPPGGVASGRRVETLVKSDRLRVVLITMRAGAMLEQHTAPGPITIQAQRGRLAVSIVDEEREVEAGSLLALAARIPHAVRAIEDVAFLLTIG